MINKSIATFRNVLLSALLTTSILNANAAENAAVENKSIDDMVVAVVNGTEIKGSYLKTLYKNLEGPWKQYDFDSLFTTLRDSVVRIELAKQYSLKEKLNETEAYKEDLAFISANVLQDLALKRYIDKNSTEEKLQEYYKKRVDDFVPEEERKTRHILVETKESAEKLIQRLNEGEDFAKLAEEASTGPSKSNGGELGWASKNEFVPEFSEAAWKLEKGAYGVTPVKTSFGYHVILVEDIRETEAPQFEDVKALLEGELRRDLEEQFFTDLQSKAVIERFDMEGNVAAEGQPQKEVQVKDSAAEAATSEDKKQSVSDAAMLEDTEKNVDPATEKAQDDAQMKDKKEPKTAVEKVEDTVDEAVEDTKKAMDKTEALAEDATEKAGSKIEEKINKVKEKIQEVKKDITKPKAEKTVDSAVEETKETVKAQ